MKRWKVKHLTFVIFTVGCHNKYYNKSCQKKYSSSIKEKTDKQLFDKTSNVAFNETLRYQWE